MLTIHKKLYSLIGWLIRVLDKIEKKRWNTSPLSNGGKILEEGYLNLAERTLSNVYPEIDKYEISCGAMIDREWLTEVALHTQVVDKKTEICYAHGRVLYSALYEWLIKNPPKKQFDRVTIYETGTARGFSALCMAKALYDAERVGVILTFDVLPHNSAIYWNCIDDIDGKKTRNDLLSKWREVWCNYIIFLQGDTRIMIPAVQCGRINFAFIDGAHDYKNVMREFNQIGPYQKRGDKIIFDDCNSEHFPGVVSAVEEICMKFKYDRINLCANSERNYVVATKE